MVLLKMDLVVAPSFIECAHLTLTYIIHQNLHYESGMYTSKKNHYIPVLYINSGTVIMLIKD